jgi:hypothetical protein
MMMIYRRLVTGLWTFVVLLMLSAWAWATPRVLFTVNELGGGEFQYNLLVDNQRGSEPLSGLNILNGNSLFGLDNLSVIGAPIGWSFFAPLPPFADDLDFFSLTTAANIAVDGVLEGFLFQSTLDPMIVSSSGFAVEGIGAVSASQIALNNARLIPEPSTLLLFGSGLAGLMSCGTKSKRSRIPRPGVV